MVEILIVSLGAILGANTRFKISAKLENFNLKPDTYILIINTFSSFCLGFFIALADLLSAYIYSYQLALFFSIGFIGSMSTFSSFVHNLYELCSQSKFFKALNLFITSLLFGILAFVFGSFLVNY